LIDGQVLVWRFLGKRECGFDDLAAGLAVALAPTLPQLARRGHALIVVPAGTAVNRLFDTVSASE